jgi:hypothetical protein
MTQTARAALRQFLGVAVDPQTYRNLAYLLLTFPLGILYFTVIVSGGSAGLGMVPIAVGVPVLVAVLALATALAGFESRLTRGLVGTDVDYSAPDPSDLTAVEYGKRVAFDPRSYLAVGYLLSKFVIGIAAFVVMVTSAALSAAFAAAPLLYDYPGVAYGTGVWSVETLPEALGLSATGVLLAVVTLHVANGAAWLLGEYTAVMLDAGEADG